MEEWKEECQCGMHEPGVASARHRRTRFIRKLNAIVHKERHDRRQTATLCRRLLQWLAPLRSRFGCNVPFTLFVGVEVHWLRRRPTKSSVHVICVLMPPFHHLRRIGEVLYIPWVSAAVATSFRDGVRRAALCKVPRAVQRRALRSTACAPPALLAISSSVGFTRDDDARARGSGGRAPPPPSSETSRSAVRSGHSVVERIASAPVGCAPPPVTSYLLVLSRHVETSRVNRTVRVESRLSARCGSASVSRVVVILRLRLRRLRSVSWRRRSKIACVIIATSSVETR